MTQYFIKNYVGSIFDNGKMPKLLYICDVDHDYTKMPRIMHSHDDIVEFVFIREGRGNHVIGGKTYETKKGDVLIYNSRVIHDEIANPNTSMSVYCCGMTNLKLKGLPENHLISNNVSCVLHSEKRANEIESLLNLMCSQIKEENTGAEELCNYLLSALITLILQIPQESMVLSTTDKSILTNRIKSYIDQNYQQDITLDTISRSLNISSFYIVHTFKENTGYSPVQYLIKRRIGEAQSLLINTNYSVTEIAGMVGYDNISYFTTLFSKNVGMTPKKYRQFWTQMTK